MATHWYTSISGNKPITLDDLASHVASGNLYRSDVVTDCNTGEVTQIDDIFGFDKALERLKLVADQSDQSDELIRPPLARRTQDIMLGTHDRGGRANKKWLLLDMFSMIRSAQLSIVWLIIAAAPSVIAGWTILSNRNNQQRFPAAEGQPIAQEFPWIGTVTSFEFWMCEANLLLASIVLFLGALCRGIRR
jgi:hypothetical protein